MFTLGNIEISMFRFTNLSYVYLKFDLTLYDEKKWYFRKEIYLSWTKAGRKSGESENVVEDKKENHFRIPGRKVL